MKLINYAHISLKPQNVLISFHFTATEVVLLCRVPIAQGNRENDKKRIPCQGKHREFGNFAKNRKLYLSSCKSPDSKFQILDTYAKLDTSAKSVL